MARVTVGLRKRTDGGLVAPQGAVAFAPIQRTTDGEVVVLPTAFSVVVNGLADPVVELHGGVWQAEERVADGITRTVEVPETGDVAYAALVDVDPSTLEPVGPPPVDVWVAALGAATADAVAEAERWRDGAEELAHDAQASAMVADGAAEASLAQATAAGQARAGAESARDAAADSRDAAASSATSAQGAATLAQGSAADALTSAGQANVATGMAEEFRDSAQSSAGRAEQGAADAEASATDAATAKTDAQTARTGAETARTDAQTARTEARAARDETYVTASSATQGAGTANLAASVTRSKYLVRTLTGNVIFTLNNGTANVAYTCTLELRQDATGGRTVTFSGTNVRLPYGLQPLLSTAPGAVDVIQLLWTGTYWVVLSGATDIRVVP